MNPRLSGIKYEWMQHLGPKVTLEELSVEGNGPMTLKLRFDGTATRVYSSGSPPPAEVPMKGVLEVTGPALQTPLRLRIVRSAALPFQALPK